MFTLEEVRTEFTISILSGIKMGIVKEKRKMTEAMLGDSDGEREAEGATKQKRLNRDTAHNSPNTNTTAPQTRKVLGTVP